MNETANQYDVIVIGGGIAGATAAYHLAASRKVLVLERESQPGYHSTGRSAALFAETYGNAPIRAVTVASRAFYLDPPKGFADHAMLTPRGAMFIGRTDQMHKLDEHFESVSKLVRSVRRVSKSEALAICPAIKPDYLAGGVLEPDAMDIDVHALHRGFLRGVTAGGGKLVTSAEVTALERSGRGWTVTTGAGTFAAPVVINAAGAWCDEVAKLGQVPGVGLVPKRRTAITFDVEAGRDIAAWPNVIDADEKFYFKPDAGRLLASPADETPMPPCDVQPDEMDIAELIDRLETATDLKVRRIASKWSGLRSFVPDKTIVAGFEPGHEGFFWLAGQGGYGIQTAPAMGRVVAAAVTGTPLPSDISDLGVSFADFAPERLRK